jgi:hypothetical protein
MKGGIGRPLALLLITAFTGTAYGEVLLTAEYKGHRYHLLDPKEWIEQNKEAQSHGWYLVAIGDQEENDFIRATFAGPRGNVWIGLTDANSEGHFSWTDGEPVTYTHWAPNEPNNDQGEGNYVHMYETGHWNDDKNVRKFFAVAEEDPALQQPADATKWLWLLILAPIAVLLVLLRKKSRQARGRNGSAVRR